jgi:pyridoxine 4-dehydrogenase
VDRGSEAVLNYCATEGFGFIPWFPAAAGDLAKPDSLLDQIAYHHNAAPSQIALAWVLKDGPVMLPIPGTSKVKHEAATVILARSSAESALRSWGLKLRKRIGFKRAEVAVAHKLAVMMHAMLKNGQLFDKAAITSP